MYHQWKFVMDKHFFTLKPMQSLNKFIYYPKIQSTKTLHNNNYGLKLITYQDFWMLLLQIILRVMKQQWYFDLLITYKITDFKTIDACIYVNSIGAIYSK